MIETDKSLKDTLKTAVGNAFDFKGYKSQIQEQVASGLTSGPKQTEALAYYTKLNAQRMKRIEKTTVILPDFIDSLKSIKKNQTWLLITESWCGDAANAVPVLSAMADQNDNIKLKLVYRDENTELIDQFLTNGGRSIPKLIIIDENFNVMATWGPRPQALQHLYTSWRNDENKVPYDEFQITMQQWYNKDKTYSIQKEMIDLLSQFD